MTTTARTQDMPPEGGYRPLNFSRVPAKSYFGGKTLIFANLAISVGSLYLYYLNVQKVEKLRVEERSSMFAVLPLLQAERDREYLKQLRRNRDEEATLMKNVDGWVVGTYRGEPVYKTVGKDTLMKPDLSEYYIHASEKDFAEYTDILLWD